MKLAFRWMALFWFASMIAPTVALAQPLTTAFTYQGELRASGVPATGLHDLRFRLYDAAAGGVQVGPTLCSDNITVADGRFTVQLDFLAAFAGEQRFLEIEVRADTGLDCSTPAGFLILGPRQPLTAAPNALFALTAASASTAATATKSTQFNGQAAAFYRNASNLNAGIIPDARISGTYTGAMTLNNAANAFTGSGSGLVGLNASSLATGTVADARLSNNVARLSNAQTFTGVKTFAAAPSFTAGGAPFLVANPTLVANLNADLLDGLESTAFLQSIPVPLALTGSNATHIIRAENSSNTSGAAAVLGISTSPTGPAIGGRFEIDSVSGYGGYFVSHATTGTNYALFSASNSTSGYALYANGRAHISGTFTASNKQFRIDHPADPTNKYLLHYTAESPEPINFYRGNVLLDAAGTAVVELPPYFARINKTPSYSLTAVGTSMPMLHIAQEIDESVLSAANKAEPDQPVPVCTFRIAGGTPGAKVSWRIEAVRNDRWIQQHGAPVEIEKPDGERGGYQHPDLYGQSK